jgi:transcriptional antiterminator RfaH
MRSSQGRIRQSYVPLFPSYIFIAGDESSRTIALKTNKISRCQSVSDTQQLVADLSRVHAAIEAGIPLTPEAKLVAGDRVRVRSGPFAGIEGYVLRREGKTRLLLAVKYIEQGVSMEIDEALLERI